MKRYYLEVRYQVSPVAAVDGHTAPGWEANLEKVTATVRPSELAEA